MQAARYADSIESLVRNNIQKMKIDMANEVIDAGRFDMKTTMGERRQTLEDMLQVGGITFCGVCLDCYMLSPGCAWWCWRPDKKAIPGKCLTFIGSTLGICACVLTYPALWVGAAAG